MFYLYSFLVLLQGVVGCFLPILNKNYSLYLFQIFMSSFGAGLTLNKLLPENENNWSNNTIVTSTFFLFVFLEKILFHSDEHTIDQNITTNYKLQCFIKPWINVVCLGIHAIFAGISLGIEEDKLDIFLLISSHKLLACYFLSKNIYEIKNVNKLIKINKFLAIGTFILVTPLSSIIAYYINDTNLYENNSLNSITNGTFLYICLSEFYYCIEKYTHHNKVKNKLFLTISMLIGLGLSILLSHSSIIPQHNHLDHDIHHDIIHEETHNH